VIVQKGAGVQGRVQTRVEEGESTDRTWSTGESTDRS
jgi:hypothetical protein